MFDVNSANKRYFDIKIDNIALEVEPPKLKTLKKIVRLSKAIDESALDDLAEAVGTILNKNRSGYVVSADMLGELDLDQMSAILMAYFEWLNTEKTSKN